MIKITNCKDCGIEIKGNDIFIFDSQMVNPHYVCKNCYNTQIEISGAAIR